MFDYSIYRHNNCPCFVQNAWMRSEGKYICTHYDENKLLFTDMEIPPECIKGFHQYLLKEPPQKTKQYGKLRLVKE